MTKVYLCGGMRSGWQEIVKKQVPRNKYFDPRKSDLKDLNVAYGPYDLNILEKCDIIFAYMEENNPSGLGLAAEIGFAVAKGITIILIDEKSKTNEMFKKYFTFIVQISGNYIFDNFEQGLEFLEKMTGTF